jgi:hypothetical protein
VSVQDQVVVEVLFCVPQPWFEPEEVDVVPLAVVVVDQLPV